MKPVPQPQSPPSGDGFTDYGLLDSTIAGGLAGKPTPVEPHTFVYDVNCQIFAEIKTREDELKDVEKSVKDAVYAGVAEIVLKRKTAELVGRPVSGLAAWALYEECQNHIQAHQDFFEKRLDSHVLRVLTHGRTPAGSESH